MKYVFTFMVMMVYSTCFSQEEVWVKTEGEIIEINTHRGRYMRETAIVKFTLEDGSEQLGNVSLLGIPYVGSFKSVGDSIVINYNTKNPVILETTLGKLLSSYGMYVLVCLGIIFSIKPFLKRMKN